MLVILLLILLLNLLTDWQNAVLREIECILPIGRVYDASSAAVSLFG